MGLCGNSHLSIPVSRRTTFPVRCEFIAAPSVRQINWFLNSYCTLIHPLDRRATQGIVDQYLNCTGQITLEPVAVYGWYHRPVNAGTAGQITWNAHNSALRDAKQKFASLVSLKKAQ